MELRLYQYINVFKNKLMFLLKNISVYLSFLTLAITQIYDFSDIPSEDESFTTANFRIFIPEDIDTIRGIYAYMHGFGGDSRSVVQDSIMKELSASIDFALLGVQLDNMHMDSGIGNSLLDAKLEFANQSNHPELIYSPLFFDGYSWGGQWSYHYSQWKPEDVIAFVTMKGGYHDTTYSQNAINVPGYMFIGEYDSDYRIENLTDIFLKHRSSGLIIECQQERSQILNKEKAMKMLKSKLYQIELEKVNKEKDERDSKKLKIDFGSQIRNYVLHPYKMIKDVRTNIERGDVNNVLDGDINDFIKGFLLMSK